MTCELARGRFRKTTVRMPEEAKHHLTIGKHVKCLLNLENAENKINSLKIWLYVFLSKSCFLKHWTRVSWHQCIYFGCLWQLNKFIQIISLAFYNLFSPQHFLFFCASMNLDNYTSPPTHTLEMFLYLQLTCV